MIDKKLMKFIKEVIKDFKFNDLWIFLNWNKIIFTDLLMAFEVNIDFWIDFKYEMINKTIIKQLEYIETIKENKDWYLINWSIQIWKNFTWQGIIDWIEKFKEIKKTDLCLNKITDNRIKYFNIISKYTPNKKKYYYNAEKYIGCDFELMNYKIISFSS